MKNKQNFNNLRHKYLRSQYSKTVNALQASIASNCEQL